jgi:nitrogen fixation/metabolism regulation signal transduction histidine kinase
MRYGISAKLLLAMLVAVALPLGASAVLLAMVADWLLELTVERRVREGLERAPVAYRALFDALKDDFEHSTDAIVTSERFCELVERGDRAGLVGHFEALVASREDLLGLRLAGEDGGDVALAQHEPPPWRGGHREWTEERTVDVAGGAAVLEARWAAPREHFDAFQAVGQTLGELEALQSGRVSLRNLTIEVYLAMLGVVVLVALGAGLLLSRRVTRRVQRLAQATRQVAAGDLTTRVPVGPRDEVGELAATFNLMVARLLESRERIEYLQRVAAWQQLARRLAHEIKNPLTPIQLAVQELRDRYRGGDERFERVLGQAVDIVIEEVEALRRLTSEFSEFAKLPDVHTAPVDLADLLGDAAQHLSLVGSERATVHVEPPPPGLVVSVDRMLMRRVLHNLALNAVQAIDASGTDGGVRIRAWRDAERGEICIAVEDDGPGIATDERQRVFEPYYTTKESGTGLGLAIVKKIVLEHGGIVTLETRREGGASFTIRLPA